MLITGRLHDVIPTSQHQRMANSCRAQCISSLQKNTYGGAKRFCNTFVYVVLVYLYMQSDYTHLVYYTQNYMKLFTSGHAHHKQLM